jgi:peptidoglycan/LPS O-acetylase OafA/YrhL
VVLAHHTMLTQPSTAAPYYDPDVPTAGLTAVMVNTPLHLLWAGTEAVYLFFVLSGFVLGLAAQSPKFTWRTYLPARLVRLYLPVIAAVALGAVIVSLLPRGSDDSRWLAARAGDYAPLDIVEDMTLIGGVSRVISPLWSLQWEVVFSLFLAAFLSWGRSVHPAIQVVVALAVSTWGFFLGAPALEYLPMFLIGTALAQMWPTVRERLEPRSAAHVRWSIVVAVALLMVSLYWVLLPWNPPETLFIATRPFVIVGVTLVLVAAASWQPLRLLLSTAPFRWAGLVSFSLYLVHEPILVAAASIAPGSLLAVACGVVVSVITAFVFFFAVERPSHRVARLVGRRRVPTSPGDGVSAETRDRP